MGLRFRQSFKLFPGVRLNLGKRGMSASFGVPGATLNVSGRGVRATVGIPGSGLSYSALVSPASPGAQQEPTYWEPSHTPNPQHGGPSPNEFKPPTPEPYVRDPGMREIGSAAVESLTSPGLMDLREMIVEAGRQRREIEKDLEDARIELAARNDELGRRKRSLLRIFFKKRIAELEALAPTLSAEVDRLIAWREATHIDVQFDVDDAAQRAYGSLIRAFEAFRSCAFIWDVTGDRDTNRIAERTTASRLVQRRRVQPDYAKSDLIRFNGRALAMPNANGEDILIYPGLILMERVDGAFALLDVRDVQVGSDIVRFQEEEQVPTDTEVVGHTWAKANKDGSPDRRFAGNYQIPVCAYGQLRLSSPTGLTEEYQTSNPRAALGFGQAFEDYKVALNAAADATSLAK